jgi:hypothetical protein
MGHRLEVTEERRSNVLKITEKKIDRILSPNVVDEEIKKRAFFES